MRAVQVDGEDLGRIGGEVGEHVAAAGGDRDDPRARLQLQRLQIDVGVFPDLRIDKALEGEGEDALADAVGRGGLEAVDRLGKRIGGPKTLRCLTGR